MKTNNTKMAVVLCLAALAPSCTSHYYFPPHLQNASSAQLASFNFGFILHTWTIEIDGKNPDIPLWGQPNRAIFIGPGQHVIKIYKDFIANTRNSSKRREGISVITTWSLDRHVDIYSGHFEANRKYHANDLSTLKDISITKAVEPFTVQTDVGPFDLSSNGPNKAPEPTPTSVTSPAIAR